MCLELNSKYREKFRENCEKSEDFATIISNEPQCQTPYTFRPKTGQFLIIMALYNKHHGRAAQQRGRSGMVGQHPRELFL
jgi:hypothetical protein